MELIIKVSQSRLLAQKVAINLLNSKLVSFTKGIDAVVEVAHQIIYEDLRNEEMLEKRVDEISEELKNEDEYEYRFVDEKELKIMIKKRLAPEYDFIISFEERFSSLAFDILQELLDKDLIRFRVNRVRVKTIIFESFEKFLKDREKASDRAHEILRERGIEEGEKYNEEYRKLHEQELRKLIGVS
ncbi:MAG TPA: DUF507 family protein [Campylobacterales bacterium]|nr:DUF507 family protein [Campylobacterales bacterium]